MYNVSNGGYSSDNTRIAYEYDFNSGQSYPLQLGSRTGGSAGSVSGVFIFGFGAADGEIHPTSAYPVSFIASDGRVYMITLPTSKTTFYMVDNLSDENMNITLDTHDNCTLSGHSRSNCQGRDVCENGPIEWSNLIFFQPRSINCVPRPTGIVNFSDYVETHLATVVIHITPTDYDILLGSS